MVIPIRIHGGLIGFYGILMGIQWDFMVIDYNWNLMGFDRGDIVTQCGWMGIKWEIEATILQYAYHGCVWPWAFPVQASPFKNGTG
jgi:hypothetical protein